MILLTYGTRPEWIKIKPLINIFKANSTDFKILFTGQHETITDGFFDYQLIIPNRPIERLNNIFASIIVSSELEDLKPSAVLVQGDTASVCAIALKYYNLKVPIIHLEAGLRTYDLENPYPEEAYRQMVSRLTTVHLCPTQSNADNIEMERCGGKTYVVGNTVLDHLIDVVPSYTDKVLCTLHRRENHNKIDQWFNEINQLANKYSQIEFILPIHPNPNVLKHKNLLTNVKVVEPLVHEELINILKDCKTVITDSGGIQEEATFLQKKVIVCRVESERMEKSNHLILCPTPNDLPMIFEQVINDYEINEPCPYGNGKSAELICSILKQIYKV